MIRELRTAYFAGLIDGEGNIGLYARKDGNKLRPKIKLNMTCYFTVQACADHFGGSVKPLKVNPNNKPQWVWTCSYNKAVAVVRELRPYLITKVEIADRVLAN